MVNLYRRSWLLEVCLQKKKWYIRDMFSRIPNLLICDNFFHQNVLVFFMFHKEFFHWDQKWCWNCLFSPETLCSSFKRKQDIFCEKKIVDSEFVKICHEQVIHTFLLILYGMKYLKLQTFLFKLNLYLILGDLTFKVSTDVKVFSKQEGTYQCVGGAQGSRFRVASQEADLRYHSYIT